MFDESSPVDEVLEVGWLAEVEEPPRVDFKAEVAFVARSDIPIV